MNSTHRRTNARVWFLLAPALFCTALLLTFGATPAYAQTASSGSLSGLVSDPQGGAVPGAEVTLIDTATKSAQTVVTNDTGRYNFPVISPGVYDITVTKAGFKVGKFTQQKVSIGVVLTLNVTLEVGSLSETVVVTSAAGSELQTTNATIGNTINLKELELLPNLGRDATSLLGLQPGVTPRGDIAGSYMDRNLDVYELYPFSFISKSKARFLEEVCFFLKASTICCNHFATIQ